MKDKNGLPILESSNAQGDITQGRLEAIVNDETSKDKPNAKTNRQEPTSPARLRYYRKKEPTK